MEHIPPPANLAAHANVTASIYDAAADRLAFWEERARRLDWDRDWDRVLDWDDAPFARWFVGGRLNATHNCVDRHVQAGAGNRVALHWIGEPGDNRDLTYGELQQEVCKAANALTGLGVMPGDRVAIYMPLVPEAVIAMLACARLGAPHTVIFGGFSAEAVASRLLDCEARVVITADGGFRRGSASALKPAVDDACDIARTAGHKVEAVLVVKRTGEEVAWYEGRDVWWHDIVDAASSQHICEYFDAEHPLYVMYTSGTTGKPKGILHTTGGYLVAASWTHWAVFDLKPESDVYWCTADLGWVTGHTYGVYGPLSNGATSVLYEGTPDTPHRGRWWEIVERLGVTVFYTAPTAIRTFMKWGAGIPEGFDLSTLRVLGSVGEPINPAAYKWYHQTIGGGRAPVVDTWWQTETGSIMISPLPGITAAKPGAAMTAMPGVCIDVFDEEGMPVPAGGSGLLVVTEPWPAMLRTLWRDDDRYREAYWSRFDGIYFSGDGARRDADGHIWILGRVDDVMNVSGHRLSTAEIESALVAHPGVAEAAVVGPSDDVTGQAVCAFVVLRDSGEFSAVPSSELVAQLQGQVAKEIGAIAKPRRVIAVPELPKTRSGKIMRRLLLDIAEGRELGDMSALSDPAVMGRITSVVGQAAENA